MGRRRRKKAPKVDEGQRGSLPERSSSYKIKGAGSFSLLNYPQCTALFSPFPHIAFAIREKHDQENSNVINPFNIDDRSPVTKMAFLFRFRHDTACGDNRIIISPFCFKLRIIFDS
jgi:hypothetical protein